MIVAREEEVEVGRMDGALGVNGVVDSQILRTVCMNAYTCVHAVIKPIRNHHLRRLLSPGQPVVVLVGISRKVTLKGGWMTMVFNIKTMYLLPVIYQSVIAFVFRLAIAIAK